MLAEELHSLLYQGWKPIFAQKRSHERAIDHAMVMPCVMGRRTISRTICALGRSNQDWSADYKMFSRSQWEAGDLFDPVIESYLMRYPEDPIVAAFDDTKCPKTGRHIATASWQRDPMSPPFRANFTYALRFVQGSLLFPHYREGDYSTRAFPVIFQEAPVVKKPGKRASDQERDAYKQAHKKNNLSTQTLNDIRDLRQRLDQKGAFYRILWTTLDGSFCNKTIFKGDLERTKLLARCRKDARLCLPAQEGSRRKYDAQIFTPEQVRKDENMPWNQASVYYGGETRNIRFKEAKAVLWRRGAGTRQLRLIVIAPLPYKFSKHSRTNYRDPAYLLTTDLYSSADRLLQAYFDRWQIEVNHREEKDLLGVGQAQVRSPKSVPRHPAFAVACYSLAMLAALRTFGPGRTNSFSELPKWRKHSKRPSFLDILTVLRREYNETSSCLFHNKNFSKDVLLYANT
jgi:hypothetical protein